MEKYPSLKTRKTCSAILALCVLFAVTFSACGTKKPAVSNTDGPAVTPGRPATDTAAPSSPVTSGTIQSLIEMVPVSGGTFNMGFSYDNRRNFAGDYTACPPWPNHYVTIRDFYIGKYEVTQGQYSEAGLDNPSENTINPENKTEAGRKMLPVEYTSWYDTLVFCNKLSIKENLKPVYTINGSVNPDDWGAPSQTRSVPAWDAVRMDREANGYRLPTEAEWEYAARGGAESRNFTYAGSNVVSDVAWYEPSKDGKQTGVIHGVGNKKPNELGLYDMSGNVMEWCWDWFDNYPSTTQTNPTGPSSGTYRIIRGGSWSFRDTFCVVQNRHRNYPYYGAVNLGFRVARNK